MSGKKARNQLSVNTGKTAKSGKQKRAELKAKRAAKQNEEHLAKDREAKANAASLGVMVDHQKLAFYYPFEQPAFVERGYYVDYCFICEECGAEQTWTAQQQKWWYETGKGNVWSIAKLCRPCRRRAQAIRDEARRVHLEGLAHKRKRAKTNLGEDAADFPD